MGVSEAVAGRSRSDATQHEDLRTTGVFRGRRSSWLCGTGGRSVAGNGNGAGRPVTAGSHTGNHGSAPTSAVRPLSREAVPEQLKWSTSYYWLHVQLGNAGRKVVRQEFKQIQEHIYRRVIAAYRDFGGRLEDLEAPPPDALTAEVAYSALQRMKLQAQQGGDMDRHEGVRAILSSIDVETRKAAFELAMNHGISGPSPPQSSEQSTWLDDYRWLIDHENSGQSPSSLRCLTDFRSALDRVYRKTRTAFLSYGGEEVDLPEAERGVRMAERYYSALRRMAQQAELAGEEVWSASLRRRLFAIDSAIRNEVIQLDEKYRFSSALGTRPFLSPAVDAPPRAVGVPLTAGPPAVPVPAPRVVQQVNPIFPVSATVPQADFPDWVEDDFRVERAIIAGELPPGFDASRLIKEARTFGHLGLADELGMGKLPERKIDDWLKKYAADNEGGRHSVYIERLGALRNTIERALRDAYPGRTDKQWLTQVQLFLHLRTEIAVAEAACATGPNRCQSPSRLP